MKHALNLLLTIVWRLDSFWHGMEGRQPADSHVRNALLAHQRDGNVILKKSMHGRMQSFLFSFTWLRPTDLNEPLCHCAASEV